MAKPAMAKNATKAKATKAKAKAKTKAKPKPANAAKAKAAPKNATARRPTAPGNDRFDRSRYELPVMDLAEAIALATALLGQKPAKAAGAVNEEAKRLAKARDRARTVAKAGGGSASMDARAYDVAMDRAWSTFVRRVQDHVELPAARRTDALQAADVASIYAIVSDLSILQLNYLAEFAQIGARLDSLKREGLLDVARTLTGAVFVDEVLRCHGEYGHALGVMDAPSDKAVDRGEARLALVEAIAEYTVQLTAQARAGRAESWGPVQRALAPIRSLRATKDAAHRAPLPPPPRAAHPPVASLGKSPQPGGPSLPPAHP